MTTAVKNWTESVINQDEINRYLINGKDFIDDEKIRQELTANQHPEKQKIRAIIDKALAIERLSPDETASLLNLDNEELWQEVFEAGLKIKKKVYDNRIITFAPLYLSNLCVNNCLYCGFRKDNRSEKRRILNQEEIRQETQSLLKVGHKRLILVAGEHQRSAIDYLTESMKTVYTTPITARTGAESRIRRININAAPMGITDLQKLREAGIGTYQVFQETYHHSSYRRLHPSTIKANYRWRLYALHRAMEAGIDDVATGALFGLYDYRFEVMGLLYHAIDLENRFGIGPHTVSFPRLNPAEGTDWLTGNPWQVNDADFKKLVAVIRLAIPYTGLIITARETAALRRQIIQVGCTQTDASTRIGIGAYSERYPEQKKERQQFMLGDTRSLDEVIREFADAGIISSFCTAGYRCGRTGDKIMKLLKTGQEGKFCKLNAILTFKEWLNDFGSPETILAGEKVIIKELEEARNEPFYQKNRLLGILEDYYQKVKNGTRDLYI